MINVRSFTFLDDEQPGCIFVPEWNCWARALRIGNIHQWLRLASHLLSRKVLIGAERAARRALEFDASDHHALNYLGMALFNQGRDTESEEVYSQLVRITPAWADAHYHRGLVLAVLDRLEEAREEFRLAYQLTPGFEPALENLKCVEEELARTTSECPSNTM